MIIEAMPVKSLITLPETGISLDQRELPVHGHAWAGDDEVKSVADFDRFRRDLDRRRPSSTAQSLRLAELLQDGERSRAPGYYEVWARATDTKGRSQPFAIAWNPKGYLNNSIFRVAVTVL